MIASSWINLGVRIIGDVVIGNGKRGLSGKKVTEQYRVGAAKLRADGADLLWVNEQARIPGNRALLVADE